MAKADAGLGPSIRVRESHAPSLPCMWFVTRAGESARLARILTNRTLLSAAVIMTALLTIECVRPRFPPPYAPRPGTVVTGIASWYGPGFHGKRTASGEIFNQNALTAAHRRWAFGTRVRVTFLKTRKSVVVRINDRMPRRDRVIDLSRGAARRIGLIGPGTGKVRLKVLR